LLYALIVAVVVYVLREIHRRRMRVNPKRPDLTMWEAWDFWLEGAGKNPDQRFAPPGADPGTVAGHVRAQAERDLLETEQPSPDPERARLMIRRAILGNATIALQLEAITKCEEEARQALIKGYEPGMEQLLQDAVASCNVKWLVLRQYARWKFDDAVASDWFHQYMHVARPYIREKVRLAKDFVLLMDEGAGRFVEIYDTLLHEQRESALKARPKKRFVRPDLPWG